MAKEEKTIFLTGDLGFMALEGVREVLGRRFLNVGVAEQNMISLAAGLASAGLRPLCYSIAPFAVFRPAEQIRLDVCLHNMDVKIVGNGGGYGYGIMGATHHALEDIAVLSSFQNMKCLVPWCNEDVPGSVGAMMQRTGPTYLRLGYGILPPSVPLVPWAPVRKLRQGSKVTIIAMGPVVLNALRATSDGGIDASVFVVSEFPLNELGRELRESIQETQKVLFVEEHVSRGGLAEMVSLLMLREGLSPRIEHLFAVGYPDGLYGSQAFHQKKSGLDPGSIIESCRSLSNG